MPTISTITDPGFSCCNRGAEAVCADAQSDESPPKRPLSAYFLFVGQNRVAVKTANPAFKSTQIVQVTRAAAVD